MKVYYNLESLPKWDHPVLTQGTFDGVHVGHRELIHQINEIARSKHGESILLTYFPHPRLVLNPEHNPLKLLNTLEEKIEMLREAGIQNLIVLEFNKKLAGLTAEKFIDEVLIEKIGVKTLIVGYDHRFGRNRAGSITDLRKYEEEGAFEVREIEAQTIESLSVSSTKIRAALLEGKVDVAASLLGRPYSISGKIVEGKRLGRELGFPTANLLVNAEYKLIPKDGVYYVRVNIDGQGHHGMLSIGNNPTVNGQKHSIEVHILDFNEEIYGQVIELQLIWWIRDKKKFLSLQDLKNQIEKDKEYVEKTFI